MSRAFEIPLWPLALHPQRKAFLLRLRHAQKFWLGGAGGPFASVKFEIGTPVAYVNNRCTLEQVNNPPLRVPLEMPVLCGKNAHTSAGREIIIC